MVSSVFDAFIYVEEIDYIILQDLSLFKFPEIGRKQANGVVSAKRKLDLGTLASSILLFIGLQL